MTENKNYRTQTSTSERNKLHLVFPGIWLMFQDVEAYSFSPWGKVPSGLLEITHCREGRLEYQDNSHRAFSWGRETCPSAKPEKRRWRFFVLSSGTGGFPS